MPNPIWSLQHFRTRVAHIEALPQLVILGLISGFGSALLISLFRVLVDEPLLLFLDNENNFEQLPAWLRFCLPISGSLLIIWLFKVISAEDRKLGVVHVLECLNHRHSILPFKNMLVQLGSASIALISGHSVGREGPAVHLGAACSSLIGQKLKLPNNALRILVGCGTAAAISAAFNTPLAGVIFAMEVVLLEYTLVGFLPIMVAAVTADVSNRVLFGGHIDLQFSSYSITSLLELPYISFMGVVFGVLAALFCYLVRFANRQKQFPTSVRILIAGVLTGVIAVAVPEVMGTGFDSLAIALKGEYLLATATLILTAKLFLTPIIIGLGIPAGLIGPSLVIGALAGCVLGIIGDLIAEQEVSHLGFYAMLGMGSMMAAVINAPLAALTALLEFTGNHNIILPGMICIVISCLTVRYVFKLPSVFVSSLNAQGLQLSTSPVSQALSRAGVSSLMDTDFTHCQRTIPRKIAVQLATEHAHLLVQDNHSWACIDSHSLLGWLNKYQESDQIDLFQCPKTKLGVAPVSILATLKEALDTMQTLNVKCLYIENNQQQICGLLQRNQLKQYYMETPRDDL